MEARLELLEEVQSEAEGEEAEEEGLSVSGCNPLQLNWLVKEMYRGRFLFYLNRCHSFL